MNILRHINEAATPESRLPTSDEIISAFRTFFNKKSVKESLTSLKKKVLSASRRLRKNTVRFNKILNRPDVVEQLNALTGQQKLKGYWASKLISVPLLTNAIDQLNKASTRAEILMGIARIITIVEDIEEPIKADAFGTHGKSNNIYKYLMQIESWTPDRVQEINNTLTQLTNDLVQSLATKIVSSGRRLTQKTKPRPAGW